MINLISVTPANHTLEDDIAKMAGFIYSVLQTTPTGDIEHTHSVLSMKDGTQLIVSAIVENDIDTPDTLYLVFLLPESVNDRINVVTNFVQMFCSDMWFKQEMPEQYLAGPHGVLVELKGYDKTLFEALLTGTIEH